MRQTYAFVRRNDPFADTRELMHQARFDHDAFLDFFCEDCRFLIVSRVPDYPFSVLFVGKSGVRALLRRIDDEVELADGRILNLLGDGDPDRVALRRGIRVRRQGAAASTRLVAANLIQLCSGKVLKVFEYIDTAWLTKLSGAC